MENELIHDTKCHQCGQSNVGSSEGCPHCGFATEASEEPAEKVECSSGARLAGGILVIFGLTALLGFALGARGGETINPVGPAIVDIWIGSTLLKGSRRLLGFAKFRVVAGAILYTGIAVFHQDTVSAVFQLVFSVALCGLLFGTAGKPRKTLAVLVSASLLILGLLGIQQSLVGHNSLTGLIQRIQLQTQSTDGKVVRGSFQGYSFGPLPSVWRMLDPEKTREMNPVVDLWFLDTGRDAAIQVIPESLDPSVEIDLSAFEGFVFDNLRQAATDVEKLGVSDIALNDYPVRILDAVAETDGLRIRYKFGLFLQNGMAIQVVCFSSEKAFEQLEGEFQKAIESLVTESLGDAPPLPRGPTDSVA